MSSVVATALKPSSNVGKLTFNPAMSGQTESCPGADLSTWASRILVVIGAASSTGQTAVAAFAAAGVHRIALVDSADTSAVQDVALRAASANNLPAPALLVVQLQHGPGGLASATHGVEEIRREWGHVDLVVHHADLEFLRVESTGGDDRVIAAQRRNSLGSGIESVYSLVDAFLPLVLSGSEKTLINIIPASSADTKPGAGAGMIAELANRGMADCLMVDHGREGLLAYSIHLSPGTYFAEKDFVDPPELNGSNLVFLTTKRREWLAGRHLSSTHDVREVLAHEDTIIREDLLRHSSSLTLALPHQPVFLPVPRRRGRVPRSSY